MRTLVLVLAVAALVVVPSAGAVPPSPALLLVYRLHDDSSLVAWGPVPDAAHYVVYRGFSLDAMEPVTITQHPYFVDEDALKGYVFYGVTASDGTIESGMIWASADGSSKGGCVAAGPGGKISVNVKNCVSY